MKDKEKQIIINEMRDDVGGAFLSVEVDTIEKLYDKGYRKFPKDSVVLSKEEYENIYEQAEANVLANIADGGTSCHWCIEQHEKIGYEKGGKETAEKILNELFDIFDNKVGELLKIKKSNNTEYNDGRLCDCCECIDEIRDFATREGVEIKE